MEFPEQLSLTLKMMNRWELNASQVTILLALDRPDPPDRPGTLAKATELSVQVVHQNVGKLDRRGLVRSVSHRYRDKQDRRGTNIKILPYGQRALESMCEPTWDILSRPLPEPPPEEETQEAAAS